MGLVLKSMGRGHLVPKIVTDKRGKKTTVYINPDKDAKTAEQVKDKVQQRKKAELKRLISLVRKKVNDPKKVKALISKYREYPINLKIMVAGKWKNVRVPQYFANPDGSKRREMITVKHINMGQDEFAEVIRQNSGLIHRILNKYSFNPDIIPDLKQAALKGVFDALNDYSNAFDPSDPPDLSARIGKWIEWGIRSELGKQMATRIQLPYNKRQLYRKFSQIYDKHSGDWDKIYNEMGIRKKDVYPAIKEGGEDPLPKEGYVSTVKEKTKDKKVKEYEKKVTAIKQKYEESLEKLSVQFHSSMGDEDKKAHEEGIKSFDKIIDGLKAKLKTASGKAKEKLENSILDYERRKELFVFTLSPMTQDEYRQNKDILEEKYHSKLKQAKKDFESDMGKTVIPGAFHLFREFEEVMSFREVNLSQSFQSEEGGKRGFEEIVADKDSYSPQQTLELKRDYVDSMSKLQSAIGMLHPNVAKIIRMRLGLGEENKPYAHGLWGQPMEIEEIAANLPKGFYQRQDQEGRSGRMKEWKANKPTWTKKVKVSNEEFKNMSTDYDKRRAKAKAKIGRWLKTKAGKKATPAEKQAYRYSTYKDHNARVEDRPTRFVNKKRSQKDYAQAVEKWQRSKPKTEYSKNSVVAEIKKDIAYASEFLRRSVKRNTIRELIDVYRDLRKVTLGTAIGSAYVNPENSSFSGKTVLKEEIKKSHAFLSFFDYKEVFFPTRESRATEKRQRKSLKNWKNRFMSFLL